MLMVVQMMTGEGGHSGSPMYSCRTYTFDMFVFKSICLENYLMALIQIEVFSVTVYLRTNNWVYNV